jgi:tetratricopeptide (TPR) repeat protein
MDSQAAPLALARHYADIDHHQAALDALQRAPAEDLEDPEYWLIRAEALRGLERYADAVESARRGLAIDPEDIALLDALALGELDQDHFDAAEKALTAALELEPDLPILWGHLALTLARAGKVNGAFRMVGKAMELAPDDVGVLRVRAQVAFLAEDPTAAEYVADLLERAPEDQTAHVLNGLLIARRKDYVPAARALAEAARLDPSSRDVAHVARETGILAHPLLAPVRPIWRIGRWRAWFIFLALSFVLAGTGHPTLRYVLIGIWVSIAALSWTVPPILRWRAKRRFGG